MGKQQLPFRTKYEAEMEEHRPGCFWGMLHVLDYHHWQYVKRLLHHKKHHPRRKRLRRCCAYPKTISFVEHAGKGLEDIDLESEHLLDQDHQNERNSLVEEKRSTVFHAKDMERNHLIDGKSSHSNTCSNKVEEELLQRILYDPRLGIMKDFCTGYDAIRKPIFTKARSFPVPNFSGSRQLKPSTLNHKKGEAWLFPGGDMSMFAHTSKITPVSFDGIVKKGTVGSSLHSSRQVNHHGWNHTIFSHFKGIKRRIQRALKESMKGSLSAEETDDHRSSSDCVNEISCNSTEDSKIRRMTRLSSLNESLDKYTRLFEESFSIDSNPTKLNNSKSLNMTGEAKINAPNTFRRRLSLPDHETLNALLYDMSYDNLKTGLLYTMKPENIRSQLLKSKSEIVGSAHELPKIVTSSSGLDSGHCSVGEATEDKCGDSDTCEENPVELAKGDNVTPHGEETVISPIDAESSSPISVLHSSPPHCKTEEATVGSLEGMESCSCTDGHISECRDEMSKEEAADFKFMCRVLQLGGFLENESMDLPLSMKLFDELDAGELHGEGEGCSEGECKCTQLLLFDLINEALMEICEGRYGYYFPRVGRLRRRRVTKGEQLEEEVWKRVKGYRSMGPGVDTTLDDIVGKDMGEGDGWMDVESDGQCVALQLEEMIFDQLMTELSF